MKELQILASNYIENISENIYRLADYEIDREQILEMIIREKYKKGQTDFVFKEEDLALVRVVNENNFPIHLEYFPLDNRNYYRYIRNPFAQILTRLSFCHEDSADTPYKDAEIGYDKRRITPGQDGVLSYKYRNTKHFSINGLASNIYGPFGHAIEFDKEGVAIIIEPLKNKIRDPRLVNLNPVDTFFDLQNDSMKIGEDAIFIIQENQLIRILQNKEIKDKLKSKKIYIYKEDPSLATDLVLMYHGYIPQHSKQQCILDIEYGSLKGKRISDEQYLNKFKEFIDQLNRKYLDTTYLEVPMHINVRRVCHAQMYLGLPGVLHSETSYFDEEIKKNLQEMTLTYEQYIRYIFDKSASIDISVANQVIESIKEDLSDAKFGTTFFYTTRVHEKTLLEVMEDLTYPVFKRSTEEFNEKKLSKINLKRRG